jgi:hypothetical protein
MTQTIDRFDGVVKSSKICCECNIELIDSPEDWVCWNYKVGDCRKPAIKSCRGEDTEGHCIHPSFGWCQEHYYDKSGNLI